MSKGNPTWLLVDVSNWAYKDLFGAGPGAASLDNFVRRAHVCCQHVRAERVAFCFDSSDSFRKRVDPMYKANRREQPAGIDGLIKGIWQHAIDNGWDTAICTGFEADDCIATLTQIAFDQGRNVVIASSDKDLRQLLVPKRVAILDNVKRKGGSQYAEPAQRRIKLEPVEFRLGTDRYEAQYFTAATLRSAYGLSPEQWVDYQCLVGDPTDNISGLTGIGDVRARDLLAKWGSIEECHANVWKHAKTVNQHATLVRYYRDQLPVIRQLVTLRRDVPLPAAWMETVA